MDATQAVITIVAANLALMMTSVGIAILLYLHTDKKIDAIAQEMKDFHGRLCSIEQEKKLKV
jgi:hypothetical protein